MPPDTRRPVGRTWLIAALGALSAFGPLSMDLYLPALPQLAVDLDATPAAAQATMSSCMVGLAVGQLLAGPLSDRVGRRRPMLAGVAVYAATSVLCAYAPTVGILVALRFVQGLGGAAGIVIARAMVRDIYRGREAARVFSLMVLVTGAAPALAPVVGSQLLRVTDWRGLFLALSAIGLALLAAAAATLRETLPPAARRAGGARELGRQARTVLHDSLFVGYTAVFALGSCGLFVYIYLSSFVIQGWYGASAQLFGAVFAANAVGIMLGGRLNATLVSRTGPVPMLLGGLAVAAAAGVALVALVLLDVGLVAILPPLFFVVGSMGVLRPNATALALASQEANAGTASAFLGVTQFLVGALVGPLVSLAGTTPLVMGSAIAAGGVAALACHLSVVGPRERAAARAM